MTVRKSTGIVFNPGSDFIRTDRGIEWGIKVTHMDEFKFVGLFYRQAGTAQWQGIALSNMDWQSEIKDNMVLLDWLKTEVLPKLQAWLSENFPKISDEPVEDKDLQKSIDLDKLIVTRLKVIENANGTLTAVIG